MVAFAKFHGLGNDFIVVDENAMRSIQRKDWRAFAKRICRRGHDVGADGILIHSKPEAPGRAAARMTVINADGSIPEMCGNGLRCFVHALVEREVLENSVNVIQTDAGLLETRWTRTPSDFQVTVDMGPPRAIQPPVRLQVGSHTWTVHPVSMGNPHGVMFLNAPRDKDSYSRLAASMEALACFPEGVNAGFATPTPSGLQLVVHERGCGFTEACGTGACAAVVAAIQNGIVEAGVPVPVELPGGQLTIQWDGDSHGVWMTGPSECVFTGQTYLA